MSKNDIFEDYIHYKLSGNNGKKPGSGNDSGGSLFPLVLGLLIGLWLILKLLG